MSEARHPESPRLLAWMDRELNPLSAWRVGRHVERCWQCRTRVSELEGAISAVVQVLEPTAMDAVDLAKARWKFRAAAAEAEQGFEPRRPRRFLAFGMATAAAALCVAVFAWRSPAPQTPPQPTASSLLAKAMSAETPAIRRAVREERFSVEYRNGTQSAVHRELRLLSSPRRGAWTARWSTERGELESALFAADAQEFTRAGGLRPAVFRKSSGYKGLFEYARSDRRDVEDMILSWIRDQVWQPVSLAREVAEFCTRSGAVLRISTDWTAVLWTAESALDGTTFKVQLEGIRGQAPAVLRIAWQSARGSGAVRLKREWRREYDDLRLAAALLYPRAGPRPEAGSEATPLPDPAPSAQSGHSLRDLLSAEVAVLHALHTAGLCRADEVQVARTSDAIEVSGGFVNEEQMERTAALLSGIPHVRARLTTHNLGSAPPLQPTGAAQERQPRPAAAEPWLRERLGVGVRASEREMFNTMNAVVRDAEDLLSDSWALVRLSRRFPPELESEMDAETRGRVREMADDHIVRISVHLAAIHGRLALQHGTQSTQSEAAVWQTGSAALHERAKHTAEVLLALFASGDMSRTSSATDPEQAGVAALIGRARMMATHVRAELSTEIRSARQ